MCNLDRKKPFYDLAQTNLQKSNPKINNQRNKQANKEERLKR